MNPPVVLYEPPKRMRTDYRVGLSAWTDKSLLEEGTFYPRKTMMPEERLWWYSRFFDMVEVNSTFYAVPSVDTATSWAQRRRRQGLPVRSLTSAATFTWSSSWPPCAVVTARTSTRLPS